jgi:hypothetical protein
MMMAAVAVLGVLVFIGKEGVRTELDRRSIYLDHVAQHQQEALEEPDARPREFHMMMEQKYKYTLWNPLWHVADEQFNR